MTDEDARRPPAGRRWRRASTGLAIAAVGGAAVLVALGVDDLIGRAAVDTDVEPAVAAAPPSTVAPVLSLAPSPTNPTSAPRDPPGTGTAGGPRAGRPSSPAVEPSTPPLAELLGPQWSAVPPPLPPQTPPVGLRMDSIELEGVPIRPVGLLPNGQIEVPDVTEIGWYHLGATAGRNGTTVLVAHVAWDDTPGPFAELGSVDPGERVEVVLDDGTRRTYEVVERALYSKLGLPGERLWRRSGPETLVMITCGGDLVPNTRRFAENIVVYAVPIG